MSEADKHQKELNKVVETTDFKTAPASLITMLLAWWNKIQEMRKEGK